MKGHYRKLNDGSMNSSTYHKKDGTNVRAILKREANEIVKDELSRQGPDRYGSEDDSPLRNRRPDLP